MRLLPAIVTIVKKEQPKNNYIKYMIAEGDSYLWATSFGAIADIIKDVGVGCKIFIEDSQITSANGYTNIVIKKIKKI